MVSSGIKKYRAKIELHPEIFEYVLLYAALEARRKNFDIAENALNNFKDLKSVYGKKIIKNILDFYCGNSMALPAAEYLEKNCSSMDYNDIMQKARNICDLLEKKNLILRKISLLKSVVKISGELIFNELSTYSDTQDFNMSSIFSINKRMSRGVYRPDLFDDWYRYDFLKTLSNFETPSKYIQILINELEINPEKKYLYADLGYLFLENKEFQKALEMFEKYIDCLPKTLTHLKKVGELYKKYGLLDDALRHFEKASTMSLTQTEIRNSESLSNQMPSIEPDYNKLFKSELLFSIAEIFILKNDTETAKKYLAQITPDNSSKEYASRARQKLIELSKNSKDILSIISEMQDELKKNPFDQDKRKKLIMIYAEQNMFDKAFEEAKRISPASSETTPIVNEIIGDIYFIKKEYNAALFYYNLAVTAKPAIIKPDGKIVYSGFKPFYVLRKMKKCGEFTRDSKIIIEAYKYYLQKNADASQMNEHQVIEILKETAELLKKQNRYEDIFTVCEEYRRYMPRRIANLIIDFARDKNYIQLILPKIILLYKSKAEQQQDDFYARLIYARLLNLNEQKDESVKILLKLSDSADTDKERQWEIAHTARQFNAPEIELKQYLKIKTYYSERNRDYLNCIATIARLSSQLGKNSDATRHYEECIELDPDNIRDYYEPLKKLYDKSEDNKQKMKRLEKMLFGEKESDAQQFEKGKTSFKQKEYNKALEYFTNALNVNPGNPDIVLNLAKTYEKLKDIANAKKYYETFYRLDSASYKNLESYGNLSNFYIKYNFNDEAIKLMQDERRVSDLYEYCERKGKLELFQEYMEKLLPSRYENYYVSYLLESYLKTGNQQKAAELINQSYCHILNLPDGGSQLDLSFLAGCYFELGNYEISAKLYLSAYKKKGDENSKGIIAEKIVECCLKIKNYHEALLACFNWGRLKLSDIPKVIQNIDEIMKINPDFQADYDSQLSNLEKSNRPDDIQLAAALKTVDDKFDDAEKLLEKHSLKRYSDFYYIIQKAQNYMNEHNDYERAERLLFPIAQHYGEYHVVCTWARAAARLEKDQILFRIVTRSALNLKKMDLLWSYRNLLFNIDDNIYLKKLNWQEELNNLKNQKSSDIATPLILIICGDISGALGNYSDMRNYYEQANKMHSLSVNEFYQLSRVFPHYGAYKDGLKFYDLFWKRKSNDLTYYISMHSLWVECLDKTGQSSEIYKKSLEFIERFPEKKEIYIGIFYSLFNKKKYDESKKIIFQALKLWPDDMQLKNAKRE